MKHRNRLSARNVAVGLLLALVAGWLIPSFLSAERYRRRLEARLTRAFHRPVSFGALSFHLLPRPGFSMDNLIVAEDPAFGFEPFVRVDRVTCDLRWNSLWASGLDCSRLSFERPSFNLVRNAQGDWNVANLLSAGESRPVSPASAPYPLNLDAEDARLDIKLDQEKVPFAVTDVSARVAIDRAQGRVTFRLTGSPVRTDLMLPTPGPLELDGEWAPGKGPGGPLDARLRTEGALLYDWIPLISGRNPDLYGLVDTQIHLTGSPQLMKAEGQARLTQLHRWDQPSPAEDLPVSVTFRAQFDRSPQRLLIETLDAGFRNSRLHLSGALTAPISSPGLDLVGAVERSHLEDFLALARHLGLSSGEVRAAGRVDGLLTVQGSSKGPQVGGFLGIREARLTTPAGTFPISEIALRIEPNLIRLAPLRLNLAPHVELLAHGAISRQKTRQGRRSGRAPAFSPFQYGLSLTAKSVPLHDLLRFGRATGVRLAEGLDARGSASADLTLTGRVWPFERPHIQGRVQVHAAQLLIPGLTEPLNVPRAVVQIQGERTTVYPLVAVMGTTVFTGRLDHQGSRQPWRFNLHAGHLDWGEGALWFAALGKRRPVPLLERLPGIRSLVERRVAARNLFSVLRASGSFSTPSLTYRALTLHDFKASVAIAGRVVRVSNARFHAGGGRGEATAVVDLTRLPARVVADVTLDQARLRDLGDYLPASLRELRGTYSGRGHFQTRGLSRQEMSAALQGQARVEFRNVSCQGFDPRSALARALPGGLKLPRAEPELREVSAKLRFDGPSVGVSTLPVNWAGAQWNLTGTYRFDGTANLRLGADLRGLAGHGLLAEAASALPVRLQVHLVGPLSKLAVAPHEQVLRLGP
jgi:AsmA family